MDLDGFLEYLNDLKPGKNQREIIDMFLITNDRCGTLYSRFERTIDNALLEKFKTKIFESSFNPPQGRGLHLLIVEKFIDIFYDFLVLMCNNAKQYVFPMFLKLKKIRNRALSQGVFYSTLKKVSEKVLKENMKIFTQKPRVIFYDNINKNRSLKNPSTISSMKNKSHKMNSTVISFSDAEMRLGLWNMDFPIHLYEIDFSRITNIAEILKSSIRENHQTIEMNLKRRNVPIRRINSSTEDVRKHYRPLTIFPYNTSEYIGCLKGFQHISDIVSTFLIAKLDVDIFNKFIKMYKNSNVEVEKNLLKFVISLSPWHVYKILTLTSFYSYSFLFSTIHFDIIESENYFYVHRQLIEIERIYLDIFLNRTSILSELLNFEGEEIRKNLVNLVGEVIPILFSIKQKFESKDGNEFMSGYYLGYKLGKSLKGFPTSYENALLMLMCILDKNPRYERILKDNCMFLNEEMDEWKLRTFSGTKLSSKIEEEVFIRRFQLLGRDVNLSKRKSKTPPNMKPLGYDEHFRKFVEKFSGVKEYRLTKSKTVKLSVSSPLQKVECPFKMNFKPMECLEDSVKKVKTFFARNEVHLFMKMNTDSSGYMTE